MNVLALSEDRQRLSDIEKALTGAGQSASIQVVLASLVGRDALPGKGDVDVLIIDGTHDAHRELAELERLQSLYPRLKTILILSQESPDVLLRALRLGVREVIKVPFSLEDFSSALGRIEQQSRASENRQGKLLAFISCKGGSGATFLATNVAYALAANHGKRVLLVDVNLQFGDAVMYVSDRRPPATLLEICRDIRSIDLTLIKSSMVEVLPNFGVLAAPDDPTLGGDIRPAHVDTLLRFVRSQFDYVVLDVGRSLDAVSIQALDSADHVYPVLQLMMPYIRDGRRLVSLFRSLGYVRDKIRPLVNRYERSSDLTMADLESAIGTKAYATIPNHYASVSASVNQGVPIQKLARTSPVTRSVDQFVDMIVDNGATRKGGLFSWLGRAKAD